MLLPNSTSCLYESAVIVEIERFPRLAADVCANRRRTERGGDTHAFLDVRDRLFADAGIRRGHLTAELEVHELHARLLGRGADFLRVCHRALVEVVDDDLELPHAELVADELRRVKCGHHRPLGLGTLRIPAGGHQVTEAPGGDADPFERIGLQRGLQCGRRERARDERRRKGNGTLLEEVASMHRHGVTPWV